MGENLPKDLFEFPDHINMSYESTLREPAHYRQHSFGQALTPLSKCLGHVYESIQVVIYYVLSATFGILLTVAWGILFGMINFITIWVAHPWIKMQLSIYRCFYICSRTATRMCFDPFYESAAIAYTRIRGGFNVVIDKNDAKLLEEVNIM